MATGWIKVDGNWFYLNEGGSMATGWKQINGTWFYLNEGGSMATGWKQISGVWYYFNEGGSMATGWKQIGNTWYYLETSGAMKTGWLKDNNKWYYLEVSGAMATGWKQVNGTWYYLYSSGVMATNTTIDGWSINASGVATPSKNNSFVSSLKVAKQTDQIVAVVGNGGYKATISLHTKNSDGTWKQNLSVNGSVGKNGITNAKKEGDGKTPSGVYSFGTGFGVANNPGTKISYRKITNNDYWVDDSNSKYYNKWVDINEVKKIGNLLNT